MAKYIFPLLFVLIACTPKHKKTPIPIEFQHESALEGKDYELDKSKLEVLTIAKINSNEQSTNELKELVVDTIIYGPDNKLAYLTLIQQQKKDTLSAPIEYLAQGFITKSNPPNFSAIKKLKLHILSTKPNYGARLSELYRNFYLENLNPQKGEYALNDTRFWTSKVWDE